MQTRGLWKFDLQIAGAPEYSFVAWLVLRLLAAVYLAAFWSLAVQVTALAGTQGICPLGEQLQIAAEDYGVWRFLAAWVTILWQVLIILTSNHNFFNLLTIALCLFLFDDRALQRVLPKAWQRRAGNCSSQSGQQQPDLRLMHDPRRVGRV
jgi:hypothetical protein